MRRSAAGFQNVAHTRAIDVVAEVEVGLGAGRDHRGQVKDASRVAIDEPTHRLGIADVTDDDGQAVVARQRRFDLVEYNDAPEPRQRTATIGIEKPPAQSAAQKPGATSHHCLHWRSTRCRPATMPRPPPNWRHAANPANVVTRVWTH